jgi:pyridoxal phosphate enzyme (YggS family)
VAQLTYPVDAERVRANLDHVRSEVALAARRAGRDPAEVEILAATKYISPGDLGALAPAGIRLVGENRAQDLAAKAAVYGDLFTWDFIGALQSRRVPLIVPHVRLIHSVSSASALAVLARSMENARAGLELLVQVNVAGENGKQGVHASEIEGLIAASPAPVVGLSTMPPVAADPEQNRQWFAALRDLAQSHGLHRLSMGTTQDYRVAVEEGATTIRIGSALYRQPAS